jgi:uncharacterized protein involved in exopolysaccharide biosynthesis/Mrp family chromosome partitioning ATPase
MALSRPIHQSLPRSSDGPESDVFEALIVRQDVPESGAEPSASLANVLRAIRRRLRLIVLGTGVLSTLGVAVICLIPPRYRAETLLFIDPRREQVTNVQEVISALPADQAALRSEIDVLKSDALVRSVVQATNLQAVPEFNPGIDEGVGPPWMFLFWLGPAQQAELRDRTAQFVQSFWDRFVPSLETAPQHYQPDPIAIVAAQYARSLIVTTDGKSLTIRLSVASKDPELATKLANLHADLYVKQQQKNRFVATDRAHAWLGERIAQLRNEVRQADAAVQSYREQNQLIRSGSGSTVTMQQLAELNSQLMAAQADRVQNESRLQRMRELARSKAPIDSMPEVLASQTIQKLHEQDTLLRRVEADALTRYVNDSHPAIVTVRAQLRDLRSKMAVEVDKIAASLQSSVMVAAAREKSLQEALQQLLRHVAAGSQAEVKLMELEREADATRGLYQTFLSRQKETSFGPAPSVADARIVSAASVPIWPSSPRYGLLFLVTFVAAAGASLAVAFFIESKEDRLRSPTQCKDLVGVPGLGLVPQVRWWQPGGAARIADRIVVGHNSLPRDAVRSILELLLAASSRKRSYSILITSTVPNEGKTVLGIWLARLAAMAGYKALLIDADLRRPAVAKALGLGSDAENPGSDATGREGLWNNVREDLATGMHHISCRLQSDEVHGRASLQRLEDILKEAKDLYDLVFVDSAPILAAPEVLSICQMTDGVVFAVRWGHTPYKQVRHAISMLQSVRANLVGAVVTRADIQKHSTYAFGDVGDVYREYRGYYRA